MKESDKLLSTWDDNAVHYSKSFLCNRSSVFDHTLFERACCSLCCLIIFSIDRGEEEGIQVFFHKRRGKRMNACQRKGLKRKNQNSMRSQRLCLEKHNFHRS